MNTQAAPQMSDSDAIQAVELALKEAKQPLCLEAIAEAAYLSVAEALRGVMLLGKKVRRCVLDTERYGYSWWEEIKNVAASTQHLNRAKARIERRVSANGFVASAVPFGTPPEPRKPRLHPLAPVLLTAAARSDQALQAHFAAHPDPALEALVTSCQSTWRACAAAGVITP